MPGKFQTLISTHYLRPYVGRHRAIDVAATVVAFGRRAADPTGGLTVGFAGTVTSARPESVPEPQAETPLQSDQTAN
jgi:hypothetical protein